MSAARRSIATLLVGTAVLFLGNGVLFTLLPVRAALEGFATTTIGAMGAAYAGGFAAGCWLGPSVVQRVGHIRSFAGFAALAAAGALSYPLLVDPIAWFAIRGFTGLCLAVLYMVIESWLNDQSSNEIRGAVLSIYIIVANLVTIGGQLLVNLYAPSEASLFIMVGMLVALSLVPLSLTTAPTPKPIAEARLRIGKLFRLSPSGFIGCLAVGFCEGAFWVLAPVFAQAREMPVTEITLFMSAFIIGGTLSQWPIGRWSDRVDRRWPILTCCLGTMATGLALAYLTMDDPVIAFSLACLHGAVMLPLYALCLAHANDYAPNQDLVEVSGGLLLLFSLGGIAGPLVVAPLMDRGPWGPGGLFLAMAVVLGLLALLIIFRLGQRAITAAKERVEFAPVPKTTQCVYTLEQDD